MEWIKDELHFKFLAMAHACLLGYSGVCVECVIFYYATHDYEFWVQTSSPWVRIFFKTALAERILKCPA